jgi:hypothetical protein
MKLTWNDLTINPQGLDFDALMESWRWLVDQSFSPVLLSALGDFFLRDEAGAVYWLDTGWGRLTKVAGSLDEFNALRVKPDTAREWFRADLVGQMKTAGIHLEAGQCYGWKTPPVLGGEESAENLEPTDLEIHFGILGEIHEQVKDLPPGTPININLQGLEPEA